MDEQRMIRALINTWAIIGADCLSALENAGEEPVMEQKDVILQCLEYVKMHGGDTEAAEAILALSPGERDIIGRKAFPFETYGW